MNISKKEIEERGYEILDELNVLIELENEKREVKGFKREAVKRLNNCESMFRGLLFDLIEE